MVMWTFQSWMQRTWLPESKSMSKLLLPYLQTSQASPANHASQLMHDTRQDASDVLRTIDKWPSMPAKEWVQNFLQTWCQKPDIWAIVVLGSIARRQAKHSFDVDLLVIHENERPDYGLPPLDVDIRSYRQEDIEALLREGHELLCWTIRFGRVLHERDSYWRNLCDIWQDRLSLPSARVADHRAARAKQILDDLEMIGDEDAAEEQYIMMLTQMARACLIRADTYPASRPELPDQLRSVGERALASQLEGALQTRHTGIEGQAIEA